MRPPISKVRTTWQALVLLAGITLPSVAPGNNEAVVLLGEGTVGRYDDNAFTEAVSDYHNAGYTVVSDRAATKREAVDAISRPCVEAVTIIGHADKRDEGMLMSGGGGGDFLSSDSFPAGTSFPKVREVVLHGCYQLRFAGPGGSWRTLFPNANIISYQYGAVPLVVFWWQWFHQPPPADPDMPSAARPAPSIHESLSLNLEREVNGRTACVSDSERARVFRIPEPLATESGDQTFNVVGYEDGNPGNRVVLGGYRVHHGHTVSASTKGFQRPDFEVSISQRAFHASLECPLSVFSHENDGIQITNHTPVAPGVLFRGFASQFFGVTEGCRPSPDACACPDAVRSGDGASGGRGGSGR